MRLELLQGLGRVVDQGKASGLATTELSLEAENIDLVFAGLVELGKLRSEVVFRDVGTVRVEDVTTGSLESSFRLLSLLLSSFGSRRKALSDSQGKLTQPSACGQGGGCG